MTTPPPGASSAGEGYWLVGQDGGIFTFGDLMFDGSALLATSSSSPTEGTVHEWGVDTEAHIDDGVSYSSVVSDAGTPAFIGQYLNYGGTIGSDCTVSGEANNNGYVLSSNEVQDIHNHGSQILLIFGPSNTYNLTGSLGQCEAEAAIALAKSLGVPVGTAIFRDVENGASIDHTYVQGWYNAVLGSPYAGGFYENSDSGEFNDAYCEAVTNIPQIADRTPLYADELTLNDTSSIQAVEQVNAPPWSGSSIHPYSSSCAGVGQTIAWQYEERGEILLPLSSYPNVDLDEYNGAENLLWAP